MTQDYKEKLLKYLTGNLDEQTGENIPIIPNQTESLNNNIAQNIDDYLNAHENASDTVVLGKIYNEVYNNYLIYGYYMDTSNNNYGFIYITDEELNEIQMITEFDSGTKLFPITALNQDENGNLYGLTSDRAQTETSKVLLFNNIFASGLLDGNYKAILRNDYTIPYQYAQFYYKQNKIIKSPNSATYYIVLNDLSNSLTKIIKFVINVGSTNDWEEYSLTSQFMSSFYITTDFSSGDEIVLFYGVDSSTPGVYYQYSISDGVVTTVKTITLQDIAPIFMTQVFVKNSDNVYIYTEQGNYGYIYKVNGNNLITIYQTKESTYIIHVFLFELNGGLFFCENFKDSSGTTIYVGYIKEDNSYIIEEITTYTENPPIPLIYGYADFYYKSSYNLINFYIPVYSTTDSTIKITFDYNSLNYNGNPYENINSLLPIKGRLYDSNNKMIFARNLYNKTINANTTVSTINVPNTLLNNKTISSQNLIGATNYTLMTGNETITKNVYENLNINFYSTLRMVNENNPQNPIFTQMGSSRINASVSRDLDYENAMCSQIRINYEDGTNIIMPIKFYPVRNYFYTKFALYIDKAISSIDFMSEDENTVYNTINPVLEISKFYSIKQKVRIDEIIPSEPVLYDNIQVQYNGEDVIY